MLDDLKVAISEEDINKARRIMTEELIGTNYPHEVFKEAIDLADTYKLFEEKDDENLKSDPKEWNMDYLTGILDELKDNFSKERFMTAYYVARKLERELEKESTENKCIIKRAYKDHKKVFIGAMIGAAVTGACALGFSVYLLSKNNKK